MNALVSIENIKVLTPAAFDALTPAVVFAPGGVEGILCKIETEVRAIDRDISTPDGRENVKSLAYKVARSKTALDDMGKELVSGIKAQAATIDAERRIIRERLDDLRDEVRGPLTAWETAEADRIAGHEKAIVFFVESRTIRGAAAELRGRVETVRDIIDGRDWQEFHDRAHEAANEAIAALEKAAAAQEQAERDAAELTELRRLKAEREEADRKAAEAAHAAEQARLVADAKAARDAQEAAAAAERERQRTEQIEREKEAAAARAVEQERQRAAAAATAKEWAERKRQANAKHRAKIHKEIGDALRALEADIPNEGGDNLVNFIVGNMIAGKIPHVRIEY